MLGQDNGDSPSVLCSDALDEAFGGETVDKADGARVGQAEHGAQLRPAHVGGVQWNGPAFNPRTNMLYVGSVDWCGTFKKAEELEHVMGRTYMGGRFIPEPAEPAHGWLTAIDAMVKANTRPAFVTTLPVPPIARMMPVFIPAPISSFIRDTSSRL